MGAVAHRPPVRHNGRMYRPALGFTPTPTWPILSNVSGSRRPESSERPMSKDSKAPEGEGRRVDFAEFAAKLVRRRAELGDEIVIPRNSGKRRTASKRALLKAIKATGADW